MKILSAGTTKYLLIDNERVKRNGERAKPGEAVAVVIEGDMRHTGFAVLTEGSVSLAYEQQGVAVVDGRNKIRAAYVTTGRVAIATDRDEELSFPAVGDIEAKAETSTSSKSKKST